MPNKKEMFTKLRNALLYKSRKGDLRQLLKELVKDELKIPDNSEEYDTYEQLIDENIVSIRNRLEKEVNVDINFTDEYVEIIVNNEIAAINKDINSIEGDEFENLCEIVLNNHLDGNIKKTIKYSFEDKHCVDLIGDIRVNDIFTHIKLYAQVKNKSGEINLNDLKEFVGGVKLIIADKGREYGFMHSCILLYISTSGFHQDAKEYMDKIGIIYIDGYKLAELIKKHNIDYKKFM